MPGTMGAQAHRRQEVFGEAARDASDTVTHKPERRRLGKAGTTHTAP